MTYLGGGRWMPARALGREVLEVIVRQDPYANVNVRHQQPPWINVGHVGRPPSEQALRDVKITFRVSETGAKWLDDHRGSLSRSAFMRLLLREAARGGLKLPDVRS